MGVKKKKGFTVVELLATLAILSMLLVIAVPSFLGVYNKFSNNYYKTVEGNVKVASSDYFTDNKKLIPMYVGEISQVDGTKLEKYGYLNDKVKGRNDSESCETYARVYKEAKGKYNYHGCIVCKVDDKITYQSYDPTTKKGDKYCSDDYSLEKNTFLVPPSNGVIVFPEEYENFNGQPVKNTLNILGSGLYTKTDGVTRINDTSVTIAPSKIEIIKGSTKTVLEKEIVGNNNDEMSEKVLNALLKIVKGSVSTEENYKKFVSDLIKNKVKVRYTYKDDRANNTVAKIDSIKKVAGVKPEIEYVKLYVGDQEITNNKGGIVYTDYNAYKNSSIDDENIGWESKTIVARIKGNNNTPIDKVYCVYENSNGFGQECSSLGKNNVISVFHNYQKQKVEVYAYGKKGGMRSNSWYYGVKTDNYVPNPDYRITNGTMGDNGWYRSDVTYEVYDKKSTNNLSGKRFYINDIERNSIVINTENNSSRIKICTGAGICESKDVSIKMDKTPPTGSLYLSSASDDGKFVDIDYDVSDALTNVVSVELPYTTTSCGGAAKLTTINVLSEDEVAQSVSGNYQNYFNTWSFCTPYTITATVKDAAGNVGTITSPSYTTYCSCQGKTVSSTKNRNFCIAGLGSNTTTVTETDPITGDTCDTKVTREPCEKPDFNLFEIFKKDDNDKPQTETPKPVTTSCDVYKEDTNCKGPKNNIYGRIKVDCNQNVKKITIKYTYNNTRSGSGCQTTTNSYSSADMDGAYFNFAGCGGSYDLDYKVTITTTDVGTITRSGNFVFHSGSVSGTCNPGGYSKD